MVAQRPKANTGEISYCKIFPPIGIARVGDSTDREGWFIGPDLPDSESRRQPGFTFRDEQGRLKRQAAQFRIYAFGADHRVLRELAVDEAEIKWSVALANKKASWFEFRGTREALRVHRGEQEVPRARNAAIGAMEIEDQHWRPSPDRAKHLEINGGTRTISGASVATAPGDTKSDYTLVGKFKGVVPVELGELRTDSRGRLLVLGGRGVSDAVDDEGRSIRDARWIRNYANNNDWYDDVSDGPVSATVSIGGVDIEVVGGAWVIVAPPDFAPDVTNVVTLYDVMEEVALFNADLVRSGSIVPRLPSKVSFPTDIAPILRRVNSYRWVTEKGLRGHGAGKPGDFTKGGTEDALRPEMDDLLAPVAQLTRKKVFSVIRKPAYQCGPNGKETYDTPEAIAQATTVFMPPLAGDQGDPEAGDASTWLSVTYLQYERLRKWSEGDFDSAADTSSNEATPARNEIERLTRVVLNSCAGGAFYPGIEMTCIAREPSIYFESFRLNHDVLKAGDVTRYMALPWQADFYECRDHWWPAQRPDDVLRLEEFDLLLKQFKEEASGRFVPVETVLFNRRRWDRGVGVRPRPTNGYLKARLLPPPRKVETTKDYIERIIDPESRDRSFDPMPRLLLSRTPVSDFSDYATDPWPKDQSGERLPSPWRLQYLSQSGVDSFSGLYFHTVVPSPDEALDGMILPHTPGPGGVRSFDDLRREWNLLRITEPAAAAKILGVYATRIADSIIKQVRAVLTEYPQGQVSPEELVESLSGSSVSDIEGRHPEDFPANSDVCKSLRAVQMLEQLTELLYLVATNWAPDMNMVDRWKNHGVVIETARTVSNKDGTPVLDQEGRPIRVVAQVETERARYDGESFRDYFYYLMNIEEHSDFIPYSKHIANSILHDAQRLIDAIGISDPAHPESFVEYSRASFGAKLEQIYEILREQAVKANGWMTSRTREERIRRILDTAPFNQTDGAWLRYVANAGPTDQVRAFLFEVWSDEVGNGDPALHHGNLFTTLLRGLGKNLPPINSRAYADNPDIHEMQYIGAVFQLAISLHSEDFFPELLGMTLFLEWEVLSLVPGIKGLEYLGIDPQFWEMHVGIDNATNGHGAKARAAVELYLDQVTKEGGQQAAQREWQRIWCGFVAFASAGYDYFSNVASPDFDIEGQLDDVTMGRTHPLSPEQRVRELIIRKAHYGKLNHRDNRLGGHRLNDLFEEPDIFLEQLSNSPWVVPGKPDESRLMNYLITFDGPMYKVFDQQDIAAWREWIEWLGREGDTDVPKRYVTKAEFMLLLLTELRELARGSGGHRRFRIEDPAASNQPTLIAEYFERGDLRDLMAALAAPGNGWVVSCDPGSSPMLVDMARGDKPMGKALDQRRVSLGNQNGRQVIIKWIEAGCPIPGQPAAPRSQLRLRPRWDGNRLIVQQFGMGAVH